jgi:hypothetical protein
MGNEKVIARLVGQSGCVTLAVDFPGALGALAVSSKYVEISLPLI